MLYAFKKFFVILTAFGIFCGGFLIESRVAESSSIVTGANVAIHLVAGQSFQLTRAQAKQTLQGPDEVELFLNDIIENTDTDLLQIRYGNDGMLRLAAKSTLKIVKLERQNNGYAFQLLQGRVWVFNLLHDGIFNLIAGNAYIVPEQTVFDAAFDGVKTVIYASSHSLTVGLIPLTTDAVSAASSLPSRFQAADFINSYLLPPGNETTIFQNTVQDNLETLKKLLYSKLVKEFQIGQVDSQFLADSWIKQNLDADSLFLQERSQQKLAKIRDGGLKFSNPEGFSYPLASALNRFSFLFTFSAERRDEHALDSIFAHLHDSEYLLLFGRTKEAKERLDNFTGLLAASSNEDQVFQDLLLQRLQHEYFWLLFVSPAEPLALTRTALADVLLAQPSQNDDQTRRKFLLIRQFLNDAYDLAKDNIALARLSLEQYYDRFVKFTAANKIGLGNFKTFFADDNQLMDNIFRLYPGFYRDGYFALKNSLEQQWLALLPEGNAKNEEKQTIISNKIDFLRQLKVFFLADQLKIEDARQIVFRLFREADDLQLPVADQAAVGELFAQRLVDYGVFFRYLNSPEFSGTALHGTSHREQYQQFLQAQQVGRGTVDINEVRNDVANQASPPAENVK